MIIPSASCTVFQFDREFTIPSLYNHPSRLRHKRVWLLSPSPPHLNHAIPSAVSTGSKAS